LEDTLTNLSTWGYVALAFFSFGGSLVVVAAAGVLSYMGEMNLYVSLAIAIIFNYIGDMFLFYLGKYHKADIKPYFEKHKRKIALSTLILRKYGVLAIFIQKFLYGIKTLFLSLWRFHAMTLKNLGSIISLLLSFLFRSLCLVLFMQESQSNSYLNILKLIHGFLLLYSSPFLALHGMVWNA